MHFLFAFLGLLAGLWLDRHGGWLYGALAGLSLGLYLGLRGRLKALERELEILRIVHSADLPPRPAEAARDAYTQAPAEAAQGQAPAEAVHAAGPMPEAPLVARAETFGAGTGWHEAEALEPSGDTLLDRAWQAARDWLTGGNIMVRAGVVVLFFGVAFLLKFAAEHTHLPVEFRLVGIALGGIAMLVLGWRLRERRPGYALVLQGGAVGVLYLTVFAALRLYTLIPPGLAFAILVVFAAFSAVLAVLQDSRSLAVLGAAGGFLAPVLTSTGEGSHVHLFSYYLVLNLGILGIAWFRSWRMLNLVGFGFTFVIASLWGVRYYQPVFFATTEPFLVAFALMYVAISVLFAFRQPVRLRGYVDATLVFGVPLVGFALQAALVRDMDNALAWSALAAAAFYVALAWLLFGRLGRDSRLLAEAFLAIGVVFATLAIPLALDARWTAGMWALEGAAMVWVARRQARLAPRAFGYLLQLGAGLAFLEAADHVHAALPLINGLLIGALIIAVAGLFTAWYLHRHRDAPEIRSWEAKLAWVFLPWGLLWWYGAWVFEILDQADDDHLLAPLLVLLFTASSLAAVELRARLRWPGMRFAARSLLPAFYLLLPVAAITLDRPLEGWALPAWLAGLWAHFRVLGREQGEPEGVVRYLHLAGVWFIITLVTWEAAWWIDHLVGGADTWWRMALGLAPAALMLAIERTAARLPRPVCDHPRLYREDALVPVAYYLWLWILVLNLVSRGASDPLPFVPVLNPMDIAVGLVALVVLRWLYPASRDAGAARSWRFASASWLFAVTLFVWLNAMWFRTAHHWLGVRFDPDVMLRSQGVQAGLAVLWSLAGLGGMVAGTRLGLRRLWFVGAGLMAAVVIKLFLVDLSHTGTMARIVSFLSVGVLLLVVGYFSPIPPRRESEVSA